MAYQPCKYKLTETTPRRTASDSLEITSRYREIQALLQDYFDGVKQRTGCTSAGIMIRSNREGESCQAWGALGSNVERIPDCQKQDEHCWCSKMLLLQLPKGKHLAGSAAIQFNHVSKFKVSGVKKGLLETRTLQRLHCESIAVVPVQNNGLVHGYLYAAWKEPGRITPESMRRLKTATDQLIPFVARLQDQESARRNVDRLQDRLRENALELEQTSLNLEFERGNLRAMFDEMVDGVYIVNRAGDIEYANPALLREFGPIESRKCWEYFEGFEEPCSWCQNDEVFAGRSVRWKRNHTETGKTFEIFGTPVRSSSGILSKLVVLHDISDQERATAALELSEHRYRTLVETMAEGLAVTDHNYRVTYVNDRFCRMLGYKREELVGRHASELIDVQDQQWFVEQIAVLPEKEIHREEVSCVRKDGQSLPTLISPMPILDGSGKFAGSFAVLTDLTQLKVAEASLRRSESQLRRLSIDLLRAQEKERRRISLDLHDDLGQELTSAKLQIGYVRNQLPKGNKEFRRECTSALQLVSRALEKVRKLSHNLNPLIVDDLGLHSALRWLLDEFGRLRKIKVNFRADKIDHLLPQGAAIVIYRIFQEIVTNIGKHARADQIDIIIRHTDGKIYFQISDNGKGFRLNKMGSGKFHGLGLLTIRERVHMLGGSFDLSSAPGKGTRCHFTISAQDEFK
jgi:two-component system, NarL family, sensor histidine kinase UhpB